MSYNQVLDNLTQGEINNENRAARFDQNMINAERERDIKKLDAIKGFSKSLDQFVQDKYKRDDEQLQKDMELKAQEEHLEAKEQTGSTNISTEDYLDYVQNRETILTNEKDLAKTANSALEQGSSFQEAKQIHNLSGAALYYYVREKSKIAADGYKDWIEGEMKNNNTIELEANGIKFTPQTAETLEQKKIALKALRREYMRQNDLGSVNPSLLNDEKVGFFDKAISAHGDLFKKYEKDDSIRTGIDDRLSASKQFAIDNDFDGLLSKIKITAKEDGNPYTYAEALDETFKVIKDGVLRGEITPEQLQEIKNQEIIVNGEKTTAGKWRKRWEKLALEIAEEQKEIIDAEQEAFEAEGDKYIMDIQAKEAEKWKNGERFNEKEIDEMIANWNPQWGKLDTYLTDLKTRSTEDQNDDDIVETFEDNIKNKRPIYQTDVNRIQDTEKWKTWTKIAKEEGNQDLIKAEKDLRDRTVKGIIVSAFFEKVENPKGNKWEAANAQAIAKYDELYHLYRPNNETSQKTHEAVMRELKPLIINGDFNVWDWDRPENQTTDQKYKKDKNIALAAIKIDSAIIKRGVIPGTEDSLKRYIESDGKVVPQIYEDLAVAINKGNPKNPISASGLAYLQAKAAGNDVENIQSEIDKEIDELPSHVKQILLRHPDQHKVARAKLELFKKDGDISYNDVEYLIHEVAAEDLKKDNKLKPLPKDLEPRIGDWKDIKGIGYVVWDGEEWIRKGNKGKYFKPYLGNVENYRDIDNFVKPYDGKYTGKIPLGAWQKLPNAVGYIVWDGKNWVRSGNKTRAAEYEGEVTELIDLDGEVKQLY